MAALDVNYGVTTDITSLPVPFTSGVWEVTRTATEDVAIESATVISNSTTSLGIITIRIYIMGSIFASTRSLSIQPTCTFGQRRSVVGRRNQIFQCLPIIIAHYQLTLRPFSCCVATIDSEWTCQICTVISHLHITITNLAIAFYNHMRIMLHESLLSTTKDITLDEGISTNRDFCLSG